MTSTSYKAFTGFAEIEIATPREGSGETSPLNEGIESLMLQGISGGINEEIAESILAWSISNRKKVMGIVNMLTQQVTGVPEYNLTSSTGRLEFVQKAGLSATSIDWSDSKILRQCEKAFPEGVTFSVTSQLGGGAEMYVDFGLIASMSVVIGGVAEGIAGEMVGLLCYIIEPDESGVDQTVTGKLALLRAGIDGWLSTAIQSHSILKRMMRGKKGMKLGAKIRNTSTIPILNHEAGELPKVGISINDSLLAKLAIMPNGKVNPDYCDVVEESDPRKAEGWIVEDVVSWENDVPIKVGQVRQKLVFNPAKLDQIVIGHGRAPMPMIQVAELVILELHGYKGEPGTLVACGDAWAYNEENETSSYKSRVMSIEEMKRLRDDKSLHAKGQSYGTNATHEGDSDGDGNEIINLEVHTLGLWPEGYVRLKDRQ